MGTASVARVKRMPGVEARGTIIRRRGFRGKRGRLLPFVLH